MLALRGAGFPLCTVPLCIAVGCVLSVVVFGEKPRFAFFLVFSPSFYFYPFAPKLLAPYLAVAFSPFPAPAPAYKAGTVLGSIHL